MQGVDRSWSIHSLLSGVRPRKASKDSRDSKAVAAIYHTVNELDIKGTVGAARKNGLVRCELADKDCRVLAFTATLDSIVGAQHGQDGLFRRRGRGIMLSGRRCNRARMCDCVLCLFGFALIFHVEPQMESAWRDRVENIYR